MIFRRRNPWRKKNGCGEDRRGGGIAASAKRECGENGQSRGNLRGMKRGEWMDFVDILHKNVILIRVRNCEAPPWGGPWVRRGGCPV